VSAKDAPKSKIKKGRVFFIKDGIFRRKAS
jgi:hypothetical protein